MRKIAMILTVVLAAAAPALAQTSADWYGCWCGGYSTQPKTVYCYEGSGFSGGCTSQINYWNTHGGVFSLGTNLTAIGAPGNGKSEINCPITSSQASSVYGYTMQSSLYGVALMEPSSAFGNFNACEDIGSPNGQPSGYGCASWTQADVLVNSGFSSGWTTSYTAYNGKAVVQTTVLHEVGHTLGFHHVFKHFSTMNYMNDDSGWFVTRIDGSSERAHYPSVAKSVTDAGVYPFKYGSAQYAETYATFTPTSVAAGGTVSLSNLRVENVGSASSLSNVVVTFYLSTDTSITTADTAIGTLSWTSFSTWWESSSAISLTIPSSKAAGTYYIGGIITVAGSQDSVTINNSFLVRTRSGSSGTPRALSVTSGGGGGTTMNETESNNSRTYANLVSTSGTTVTGYISTSSDVDYFKVVIPTKKTLSVSVVVPATTSIDYDVKLYDSSGYYLTGSEKDAGQNESFTYYNSSSYSKTVYIKVYPYSGYSTTQPYKMTVSW
ncbi:MAG: hypothetical protein AB1714_29720 [Acidobacteriota bacterium]